MLSCGRSTWRSFCAVSGSDSISCVASSSREYTVAPMPPKMPSSNSGRANCARNVQRLHSVDDRRQRVTGHQTEQHRDEHRGSPVEHQHRTEDRQHRERNAAHVDRRLHHHVAIVGAERTRRIASVNAVWRTGPVSCHECCRVSDRGDRRCTCRATPSQRTPPQRRVVGVLRPQSSDGSYARSPATPTNRSAGDPWSQRMRQSTVQPSVPIGIEPHFWRCPSCCVSPSCSSSSR